MIKKLDFLFNKIRLKNIFCSKKIEMQSISEMNKTLSQLNNLFQVSTLNFTKSINLHQTKFTHKDLNQFRQLIQTIKIEVNTKIHTFFDEKLNQRKQNYQQKIQQYEVSSNELKTKLIRFRQNLEKQTQSLKQEELRKEAVLQHFSQKFYLNSIIKRPLSILKNNVIQNKRQRQTNYKADLMYKKNLMKKAFFPWRTLTYKDGYQNRVIGQTESDIQNIHSQYRSIIQILKSKINDTDELLQLKQAAKGEFAYALNKNLMKTISNLSLQVMSLNQMSLRDNQFCNFEGEAFMDRLNSIVEDKCRKVQQYKENLGVHERKKTRFV